MQRIFKVGLILALSLSLVEAKAQGYANIEDDSPPSSQPNQQLISSLPQYDSGYSQEPSPSGNNLQGNQRPSGDQSQGQNYWWMNQQNAFQKPPGHPGVEPGENAAPQQQSNNRAPNAYNSGQSAPRPQQPRPQQPRPQPARPQQPYRPQQVPRQPQRPNPNVIPNEAEGGWTAPQSSNSLSQPGSDYAPAPPKVADECQLLNKGDCHKGEQTYPVNYDTPYTAPVASLPPQNYRPPTAQPPRVPYQQPQAAPAQPVRPPPGFYKPPQIQPQPYDNQPNAPSNQNYQPQYSSDSQSQSSAFPQSARPQQPYRPQPQQTAPQQYRPKPQQQQQYYQSQPQQSALYPGCPAAMLCVQEDQCNMIGVIEENLRLSDAEKAFRVALSQCSEPSTGIPGICCRDPNYKDPWPDMNGNGGQHQHHQEDSQSQGQQPQGQSQRNPYSAEDNADIESDKSSSASNPFASVSLHPNNGKPVENYNEKQSPKFHQCGHDEECIIHYKCPKLRNERISPVNYSPPKKCKEDVYRNVYVCCKPHGTNKPLSHPPPTIRPTFSIAKSQVVLVSHEQSANTVNPFYRNNQFLTNTFPTTRTTPPTTTTTTTEKLITGFGLRFHSQLHTASALEANRLKPNPYFDPDIGILQPAFVTTTTTRRPNFFPTTYKSFFTPVTTHRPYFTPTTQRPTTTTTYRAFITSPRLTSTTTRPFFTPFTTSTTTTTHFSTTHTPTTTPTSTTPPTSTTTNSSTSNTTTEIPANYTEVYEPPADRERLQNFWTQDNHLNQTELDSKIVKYGNKNVVKVDINRIPKRVTLRPEFLEYPPPGFVWKGYDLDIPDVSPPPQHFQPPRYKYGERNYPIPEDFITDNSTTTTASGNENSTVNGTSITTTALPEENAENSSLEEQI